MVCLQKLAGNDRLKSIRGRRNPYFFGIRLVLFDNSNYLVQTGSVPYDPVQYNHLLGASALNLMAEF